MISNDDMFTTTRFSSACVVLAFASAIHPVSFGVCRWAAIGVAPREGSGTWLLQGRLGVGAFVSQIFSSAIRLESVSQRTGAALKLDNLCSGVMPLGPWRCCTP